MGVSAGDYDRDGWLDIVKTNFDDDTPSLYRNLGRGTVRRCDARSGIGCQHAISRLGCGFLDVDLDSWPDILIVNGHVYPEADRLGGHYSYEQPKLLYRNLGNGRFEDVSTAGGVRRCSQRRRPAAPPSATSSTPARRMSS